MKKEKYISHFVGFLMLFVVLFSSILSSGMPLQSFKNVKVERIEKKNAKKNTTKHVSLNQQKNDANEEGSSEQASISELTLTGIVPSHAFDFGHDAIVIPTPQIIFVALSETKTFITKPLFRISYFEKLFEHHIAINAP